MKMTSYHPFRSEKARERYLRYYDERAKAWPVAAETKMVDTSFGATFMRISGPVGAPPLVLLPSASATSLFWAPNIEALSSRFQVYTLDNIYDFGRSVYARAMKIPTDYVNWLDELFDALGFKGPLNLMGLSFGAWLTVQYAVNRPQRLRKIVFLAPPATLFPLPGKWAWYGLSALIPHRYFMRRMTRWMAPDLTARTDEISRQRVATMVEDAFIGLRCFKLKMPVTPTVLTDDELGLLTMPALFLVGEHEVIYSADKAVERLNRAAPQVKTVVVPAAGHDLTIVQADLVNRTVLDFLGRP